jgi:hypothetical protein
MKAKTQRMGWHSRPEGEGGPLPVPLVTTSPKHLDIDWVMSKASYLRAGGTR